MYFFKNLEYIFSLAWLCVIKCLHTIRLTAAISYKNDNYEIGDVWFLSDTGNMQLW